MAIMVFSRTKAFSLRGTSLLFLGDIRGILI